MKKQRFALIAFALIATCVYGADQVISLWGDADSYTAIVLSGKQFYILDEQGKRGPYAKVFPFDSKDGSRRAWGAEGDEKKGYFLIGDGDQRFGPYSSIGEYRDKDRKEGKVGLMICRKGLDLRDLVFCDGERLEFMSQARSVDDISFDREGKTAAMAINNHSAIAIGSTYVPMSGKDLSYYGFLGEPGVFWASWQRNSGDYNLVSVSLDSKGLAERKVYFGNGVTEDDILSGGAAAAGDISDIRGFGGTGGSGYYTYSDDRSGMILKYETRDGGFIFTGRETLGPYYCDKEWLKADDGAISADGKELVFPFKKKEESYQTYLYFRGATVGPFDSVIGNPWFAKDGTGRAYARVMKGGKAYLLLDGREIGGPWDEVVDTVWGWKNEFQLVVKKDGQSLLFDPDTKTEGPLPAGKPERFYGVGSHKGIVMSEGDYIHKDNPHREWFVIDGKPQSKFDSVGILQGNGSDDASPIYIASQNFLWYLVDGERKLGPYDQVGSIAFFEGGYVFSFRKDKKIFIGKSDGSSLALPFEPRELEGLSKSRSEAKDLGDLVVSSDGRIIQFDMSLPVKGQESPLYLHRVLIDGKPHVGHFDTVSGTVLIWDEKAKEVKRLTAGR